MARTQKANTGKNGSEMGVINTLFFESKKDEKLLQLVNQYASLMDVDNCFKPKSLIRKLLLEVLSERINQLEIVKQQKLTA